MYELSPDLQLWHRMLCVLLAYIFLIGPEVFHQLARADIAYGDLCTTDWANGGETVTYQYDANGSMTGKVTNNGSNDIESVTYRYNLQNRLSRIVTDLDPSSSSNTVDVVDYTYDASGIRTSKYSFIVAQNYLDTEDEQDYATDKVLTEYLIDTANHTGYAQVLEETTGEDVTYYTIGDDVLAQTLNANNPKYLLYDGHGSTRQLVASDGSTIADSYSYDAYGVMLGGNPTAANPTATNLLYAGEQFDIDAQQYYLRARYYNPLNGTFNRTDPYTGNMQDPQSLHKYTYCYNDPINNIDPLGMFSLGELNISMAIRSILTSISTYATAAYVWAGTHMALITAFSYYAMWTFILSSLWVGMEDAGVVPEVSLVGDITVAKGLQIISGSAFFLGLLVMGSVPDLERGKLAQQVQTRAYELRKSYSQETHKRITMSVGIAENKAGERVTLIATSENTRQGLYTRPGVTLKTNEIMVSGEGHAEQRIVKFCEQTNMHLLTITATRKVCEPICVPEVTPTGADIIAPISDKDLSIK